MFDFMFFFNSILLGVGLAMDAFSVSLANGLNEPTMKKPRMCGMAGIFSFFQFAMPMIGWICVSTIAQKFKAFDLLQRKISEYELEELKKQAGPVTTEQFLKILKENKKTGHVEGKPAWWSMPQTQEVLGKFFQKTYVTIGELFDLKKVVSSFSISKEK